MPSSGRSLFVALVALVSSGDAMAHGDLEKRIAALTKEMVRAPRDASLFVRRGNLYRIHRDFRSARRDLSRARKLAPKLPQLDFQSGRLEIAAGRLRAGVALLERQLEATPGHIPSRIERARALARLGDKAALLDFDRALRQAKRPTPDLYLERARAQRELKVAPAKIVAALDAGIARLGPVVGLHLLALEVELSAKRFEAALSRLQTVAAAMPLRAPWLLRTGMVHERMGQRDAARKCYRAGLAELERLAHRNASQLVIQGSLRRRLARLR